MKQEEIDEMLKEAPGPINFTVFLTMFGEKLKGKGADVKGENVTIRTESKSTKQNILRSVTSVLM